MNQASSISIQPYQQVRMVMFFLWRSRWMKSDINFHIILIKSNLYVLKSLILCILFLFGNPPLSAQQPATDLQLFSTNEGLSQGMVLDILQSRDGFIWIATKDGLNRYDGSRFVVYAPDPFDPYAIGGSEVYELFEDSRGLIWIAFSEGLDVFDPIRGRFYHLQFDNGLDAAYRVYGIAETPDGTVWLTDNQQLIKISIPEKMVENAQKQGKSTIKLTCKTISMSKTSGWSGDDLKPARLLFSKTKGMLIGTNHGLFRMDILTGQLSPLYAKTDWQIGFLSENEAGDILAKGAHYDGDRAPLWAWFSDTDIQFYEDSSRTKTFISRFQFDKKGFFWTYRNQKIQKWSLSAFFSQGSPELEVSADSTFSVRRATCTTFMFDKSGVGWIGTNGYGLFKVTEKTINFKTFLSKNSHRLLLETPDGGIYSLEQPRIKYPSIAFSNGSDQGDFHVGFPADQFSRGLFAACFDAAGNAWSSHQKDSLLFRTDARTKTRKSFPWQGFGLLYTKSGHLVSVNQTGLRRFDPKTEISSVFPFDTLQKRVSDYSTYLYEDAAAVIWIFGLEGLIKAIPNASGYHYEKYINNPQDRNSISANIVLSVADDPLEPHRFLWVGTKSGGLNRLDKETGKFKAFKTGQGLPDNVVYGVLAENPRQSSGNSPGAAPKTVGFIWLSTNKGLCRFDVRSEQTKNFVAADGLQDNEFNSSSYLKMRDGTMIFGGVRGLTLFHPESLRFNEKAPQILIVDLQVNNRQFDIKTESPIIFSHDQNLLTFNFAALEFTSPVQNQYRYQLEGIDKKWVNLGNKNSIQFANLPAGNYTLKVEGSNNDGTWSEKPATLSFVIRPPWWASWWAILVYLSLIVAAIWRYNRYKLQQKYMDQERLRLNELDDFKGRFFTNITHEFRTPLTVILGISQQVAKEEADEEKRNKLGLIYRNGENLLQLVNQILDLSKLESNSLKMSFIQGNILAYLRYIVESLHSYSNAQNILLKVESSQSEIVMDYEPERFLQIIHNLLSNAIKFTPSGGKVHVRLELEGDFLHIWVTDTGYGIPPEEVSRLFQRYYQVKNQGHPTLGSTGVGLSLTNELVKAMGGTVSVESKLGVGSTFLVKLPVTRNAPIENTTPHPSDLMRSPASGLPSNKLLQPKATDNDFPNILIIEDNPDVVEYLAYCLKRDFHLELAFNGQIGIEKALESIPDLILCDLMMPIKDGFEVLEALKNDERTSHIPIILLTAKADIQSRLSGLRRGADAYIPKPFHAEELHLTISSLLENRKKMQLKYQQQIISAPPLLDSMPVIDSNVDVETVVQVPTTIQPDQEDEFLQKVRAIIEANYTQEEFGLPILCQKIGMSRSQLFRKLKALTDIAPSDLIRKHRLHKAKELLEGGKTNVSEAAWEVGFKDPSYFSKLYQEEFGMVPSGSKK